MRKDYTENQKQYQAPEMKVIALGNETQLLAGTTYPGTSTPRPGHSALRGSDIDFSEEE